MQVNKCMMKMKILSSSSNGWKRMEPWMNENAWIFVWIELNFGEDKKRKTKTMTLWFWFLLEKEKRRTKKYSCTFFYIYFN
jgi:hypothetical protein